MSSPDLPGPGLPGPGIWCPTMPSASGPCRQRLSERALRGIFQQGLNPQIEDKLGLRVRADEPGFSSHLSYPGGQPSTGMLMGTPILWWDPTLRDCLFSRPDIVSIVSSQAFVLPVRHF